MTLQENGAIDKTSLVIMPKLRLFLAGMMLVLAAIVLIMAVYPLINPHPITLSDTVGDSTVTFHASRPVGFWQKDACVDFTWETNNIREIFFMGKGTIGAHTETRCIGEQGLDAAWLRVHFGRNVWQTYRIHHVTFTPLTLLYMLVLFAAAGMMAFFPFQRPQPLRDVRTIRAALPYMLPVLLPLGYLLISNLITIDFGWHWDEMTLVNQVRRSIDQKTLIPDFYNYPSLNFAITLVALLRNPAMLFSGDPLIMDQITREGDYLPFARSLFLILSSLAIVWTYALVIIWRRRWLEALIAASCFALSWEVAYHLRWIAPDGLLMSFGALTILLAMTAYLYPNRGGLFWGAVIAAGLSVGSKYPGGLIILPVFIVGVFRWWGKPLPFIFRQLVIFGLIFIGAYLVTTPGTIFAFADFRNDIVHEIQHYGDTGQGYYTVEPGFGHLVQLLAYLSLVMFSHYPVIAASIFALALLGAVTLIREDWQLALIFLIFPVLYVLYFSTQSLMYVRNMLVTVPFWSILAAHGFVVVWKQLRYPLLRYGWAVVLVMIFAINAVWLGYTTRSVLLRGMHRDVAPFLLTLEANPDTVYWAAEGLYEQMLERYGDDLPANIQPTSDGADILAVPMRKNLLEYDTNYGDAYLGSRFTSPWRGAVQWFGAYEVNLNYYPGWDGDDRIVLIPVQYVATWKQ